MKWDGPLGLDFGFGLWRLHNMPAQRLQILYFYWLFSAHLFGLSTKFGHLIPQPLDLDKHKVEGAKTNTPRKTNTYKRLPIANTLLP
jgi:hypothetical protein